MKLAEQNSLVG